MSYSTLKSISAVAVAMALSAPALADDAMSYTYLEAAYVDTELDDFDVDGDGLGLKGSFDITDSLFLTAAYGTQEFDQGVDLDQWSVGLGGHMPLSDQLDLVGELSYVSAEIDTGFGDFDDDGFGASVGLRAAITEQLQLEGGLNYVDLDDAGDDTSVSFGGRYYFTPEFAVGAGIALGDDATTWNVGVRLEF